MGSEYKAILHAVGTGSHLLEDVRCTESSTEWDFPSNGALVQQEELLLYCNYLQSCLSDLGLVVFAGKNGSDADVQSAAFYSLFID